MPVHDDLGKRMKTNYEQISKYQLTKRTPVIIRIDGKAFHTFTRGFKKPFDRILMECMQETMKYLCENIQGCVLGYTQSDEISLFLVDYKKLNSSSWFDNEVQKMSSVSASMATMIFNKIFNQHVDHCWFDQHYDIRDEYLYHDVLELAAEKGGMFDSRVFNIPKEEVTNYFYWRQLDATRNSIEMVGQANFSHKELQNKNCNMIQDMLHEQKGINWNNYPTDCKRGSCCYKIAYLKGDVERTEWIIDHNIPIFINDDRDYIERWVEVDK